MVWFIMPVIFEPTIINRIELNQSVSLPSQTNAYEQNFSKIIILLQKSSYCIVTSVIMSGISRLSDKSNYLNEKRRFSP